MTVTRIAPGVYRVETDGRAQLVFVACGVTGGVAGGRGTVWAFTEGQVFVEREPGARDSDDRGSTPGLAGRMRGAAPFRSAGIEPLTSPMPGTVLKILVEPGMAVKAGVTAVIMEAMKMELPLRVLDDGVVAEVKCRAGELVDADVELVTFRARA